MSSESTQLRRSWVANAATWTETVRNHAIESRRVVTDAAIVTAVLDQHPQRALDAGCGEGWLARALAAHGVEVTGFDASLPLLEEARRLGGATFHAASYEEVAANPSLLGAGFDVVVASFSLLEEDVAALLRALRELLSPQGRVIVQTVHPVVAAGDAGYEDGWRTETFAAIPGQWSEPMPWYFRTLSSWTRLFADAGYALVEIREPMYPDRPAPASIIFVLK